MTTTKYQNFTADKGQKSQPNKMAHLVFPDTRANAQKTKRAIFLPTL